MTNAGKHGKVRAYAVDCRAIMLYLIVGDIMEYIFYMVETSWSSVQYTVEADSPEEAIGLAEKGDTIAESYIEFGEVIDRRISEHVEA